MESMRKRQFVLKPLQSLCADSPRELAGAMCSNSTQRGGPSAATSGSGRIDILIGACMSAQLPVSSLLSTPAFSVSRVMLHYHRDLVRSGDFTGVS